MTGAAAAAAAEPAWTTADWRIFGTGARMVLPAGSDLTAAREVVDCELAAIDLAASRFRDDSEISVLNRAAGTTVVVSDLLAELIGVALGAAESSGGAVDPTVGELLQQLGYDRTFRDLPPDGPAPTVTIRRRPDWRAVEFDGRAHTVRLPPGVTLDLGATAKAHASDRAAALVHEVTDGPVLVSLGGDITVAGPPPEGGWTVAVAEDSNTALTVAGPRVVISGGGLATSSKTVRQWRRGGDILHHLIDPWQAHPAAGPWRTATVAAATCLEANVAATAAIVLGESAVAWLAARGLPARLVSETGTVRVVGGWPEEHA